MYPMIRMRCVLASALLFTAAMLLPVRAAVQEGDAVQVTLHADKADAVVNKNIYGHFAEHLGRCIYEGIWVGESSSIPNTRGLRNDVLEALRRLKVPVLRWPGGCFADEYHWKDGIGPRAQRPSMINTHWGGVVENNHFGTHEFMDLCELIGAEPYVCGNVGSGTPQEMMEWVEYMTSDAQSPMANLRRKNGREEPWRLTYFGVGNESWGCGGNMRPEFYADNFRRYATFVKNYPGNRIYRIACGANDFEYNWTEVLMQNAGRQMNGLSLHYYTLPTGEWKNKGEALGFGEAEWFATLERAGRMDEIIAKHSAIMDKHDRNRRVGLVVDEWGTWYNPTKGSTPGFLEQQNSLRDALVAGIHFHIFHKHAERVVMANIAQTINVLQAMILTAKEKMLLTPTYHVFEMFKEHQGGRILQTDTSTPEYFFGDRRMPAVSVSATRAQSGAVFLSVVNRDPQRSFPLNVALRGMSAGKVSGRLLTAEAIDAHNSFDSPRRVAPIAFNGARLEGDRIVAVIPAKSILTIEVH